MRPINKITLTILFFASSLAVMVGCNKNKKYSILEPESKIHFVGSAIQNYTIDPVPVPYTITIGTTDVSDEDRTITFSASSPTGLVAGTDYTLSTTSNTLTIPAGQTTASFTVLGTFSSFANGEKDTLVLTLEQPGTVDVADFLGTIKIFMRGPCFDGDISDIKDMGGTFANATDPDDPVYTVTISNFVSTGPTTATAKIANLWDWFDPVDIVFDWTDPTNTKVSIARQVTTQFYSTANNQPFSIRTSPGQTNKFSICNERLTLIVDLIVENYPVPGSAAYYEQNYPMTINR